MHARFPTFVRTKVLSCEPAAPCCPDSANASSELAHFSLPADSVSEGAPVAAADVAAEPPGSAGVLPSAHAEIEPISATATANQPIRVFLRAP